jgi:hypothetical protein
MAIPARGLNNIRTLAGRVDPCETPYRGFMQITCLEMEKARRKAERASAALRIHDLDARLEQIEKEKQVLLAAVAPSAIEAHSTRRENKSGLRKPGGFRIRY